MATAQIMLEEGYAASTSRRVAAKAGVKPALVHYYFPSMDDLFLAVLRDSAETLAMRSHGADVAAFPPVVMSMIVTSLARILLLERGLVITRGHDEAEAFIERYLDQFEMPAEPGRS